MWVSGTDFGISQQTKHLVSQPARRGLGFQAQAMRLLETRHEFEPSPNHLEPCHSERVQVKTHQTDSSHYSFTKSRSLAHIPLPTLALDMRFGRRKEHYSPGKCCQFPMERVA